MFNQYKYKKELQESVIPTLEDKIKTLKKKCDEKFDAYWNEEPEKRDENIYKGYRELAETIEELKSQLYEAECESKEKVYMCQYVGSDIYPYELVERRSKTVLWVRQLDFTEIQNGYANNYKSNRENEIVEIRLHKNGGYYERGHNYCPFRFVIEPHAYMDPCF